MHKIGNKDTRKRILLGKSITRLLQRESERTGESLNAVVRRIVANYFGVQKNG